MLKKKRRETILNTLAAEFPYMELLSDNAPQISPEYYEDAEILNQQVNNPNAFNIAVMAKYGAGKSSVINTYLSIYRSKDIKKKVKINKSNAIYKLLDALLKRKLIKDFGKVRNKEEYWIS